MDRTLSYTIEAADDGENVGEYLRHHGYSQASPDTFEENAGGNSA